MEYVSTKVLGLLPGRRLLPQAKRDGRRRGQKEIKLSLILIKVINRNERSYEEDLSSSNNVFDSF